MHTLPILNKLVALAFYKINLFSLIPLRIVRHFSARRYQAEHTPRLRRHQKDYVVCPIDSQFIRYGCGGNSVQVRAHAVLLFFLWLAWVEASIVLLMVLQWGRGAAGGERQNAQS